MATRIINHLLFVISFFLMIFAKPLWASSQMECKDIGPCETCDGKSKLKQYCQETGKKLEMSCILKKGDLIETTTEWRSCQELSSESEIGLVIIFLFIMAAVGTTGYWQVQKRKVNTMSKFDYRKKITIPSNGHV